jgi:uncharacterized protein (TIGR00159 family)
VTLLRDLLTEASLAEVVIALMDILLVYYLIYRVLLTIKGTRAAQMMTGIVLIGAAFYAAERFEMTTVSWLLDNFIQYFIIIVIVVFQQDIRRALIRIGQNVSQWGKTTREVSHALDEVIAAAEHLAKARIGGIVVFEREANLDDFINSGKLIGAQVSKELLVSLFVPSRDNELHDGAVVLRELEIFKAGVVLPLSRGELASDFGTRHRAAIGITEETDAVAVVISEERGEISLCFRGGIARDLESDTLRQALDNLFAGPKATAGRAGAPAIDQGAEAALAISKAMAAMAGSSTGEHRAATADDSSSRIRMPTRPDPTVPR